MSSAVVVISRRSCRRRRSWSSCSNIRKATVAGAFGCSVIFQLLAVSSVVVISRRRSCCRRHDWTSSWHIRKLQSILPCAWVYSCDVSCRYQRKERQWQSQPQSYSHRRCRVLCPLRVTTAVSSVVVVISRRSSRRRRRSWSSISDVRCSHRSCRVLRPLPVSGCVVECRCQQKLLPYLERMHYHP